MKQASFKFLFAISFTLFSVLDSFGQIQINESFFQNYGIYRSWSKDGTPGEYNRTKRIVRFEFTPTTIKQYWGTQGVVNMRWDLAETYTIIQSEIRKSDDGSPIYLYLTSNKYQIGVNRGSFQNIIIFDGSKNLEYVSQ